MLRLTGRLAVWIGLGDVGILAVMVVGVSARLFVMRSGLLLLLSRVLDGLRLLLSCAGGDLILITFFVGHLEHPLVILSRPPKTSPRELARSRGRRIIYLL